MKQGSVPGHCKAAAQRISAEAEIIATRLAHGQTCKDVAPDYPVHYSVFCRHAQIAIGIERWRALIRPGVKRGHLLRQGVTQVPEQINVDTGRQCFLCTSPIQPDARVCPHCGNLLRG